MERDSPPRREWHTKAGTRRIVGMSDRCGKPSLPLVLGRAVASRRSRQEAMAMSRFGLARAQGISTRVKDRAYDTNKIPNSLVRDEPTRHGRVYHRRPWNPRV